MDNRVPTTQEIADQFDKFAKAGKWFEIQDAFFSDDVKSIDPAGSPYFGSAEGRAAVRQKGMDFVSTVTAVHSDKLSAPLVGGNFFAVAREIDLTTSLHGRFEIREIMLYEVKDGQIIREQFFY